MYDVYGCQPLRIVIIKRLNIGGLFMKLRFKRMLAVLLALVFVLSLVACGNRQGGTTSPSPTSSPSTSQTPSGPAEVKPDVPANRYDATATPRTGNNATMPLVLATNTLDGKFSPFFYTSAYDGDVVDLTQLYLLFPNKKGEMTAGIDVASYAYDYEVEVASDNSKSTYTFILKNGLTFSDGKPITVKDVLFSMYVLADPKYDGSSTFYTMKIQGLSEYRLQTSADTLKMVDAILEAGITSGDDGKMVINPASGVTMDKQEKFWSYLDEAGAKFAQEIIDYVNNNYRSYIERYFAPYTPDQVAASPSMQAAFGIRLSRKGLGKNRFL